MEGKCCSDKPPERKYRGALRALVYTARAWPSLRAHNRLRR